MTHAGAVTELVGRHAERGCVELTETAIVSCGEGRVGGEVLWVAGWGRSSRGSVGSRLVVTGCVGCTGAGARGGCGSNGLEAGERGRGCGHRVQARGATCDGCGRVRFLGSCGRAGMREGRCVGGSGRGSCRARSGGVACSVTAHGLAPLAYEGAAFETTGPV